MLCGSLFPTSWYASNVIISACRLGIDDAELDSGSDDDDDNEEFAEQGVVSTGESSDSVDDSWDRPGPSGLQNTGCSSEGTPLQDDGYEASSCSNSEHAPQEDPPVLSSEMDNGENENVDQKCETKEDSLPVKVEGENNEMNERPETVNGGVGEENTGSNEQASVGDSSGENGKDVSEEGERSAPSEQQQQHPATTEGSTQEVSLKLWGWCTVEPCLMDTPQQRTPTL